MRSYEFFSFENIQIDTQCASGLQTALNLLGKGGKVYLGGRTQAKFDAALAEIKKTVKKPDAHFLLIDHLSLASVVKAAEFFKAQESTLHCLINNAGIMGVTYATTSDGFESQWQTNYLAHWLLTYHLTSTLLNTASSPGTPSGAVRVVNVSATPGPFAPNGGITFDDINGEKGTPLTRYGMSKVGDNLHVIELNRRFGPDSASAAPSGRGLWTASLHPGVWIT